MRTRALLLVRTGPVAAKRCLQVRRSHFTSMIFMCFPRGERGRKGWARLRGGLDQLPVGPGKAAHEVEIDPLPGPPVPYDPGVDLDQGHLFPVAAPPVAVHGPAVRIDGE